jgi:flagellar biosynthetic protein FlhB
MSDADNDQEKSHDPTPSRLDKARRDGDVAQSREANAAAQYLGLYAAIVFAGGWAAAETARALAVFHHRPLDVASLILGTQGAGAAFFANPALPAVVVIGLPLIAVLLALVAQQSIVFAPKKLEPKMSRLSLVENAKQKFGPQGLGEFARGFLKLAAIIASVIFFFGARFSELPATAAMPAAAIAGLLHREAALFLGVITIFSVAMAAIDLPLSRMSWMKRLRMSQEELKRESKENEGDPLLKMIRREKGKAIAVNRMMRDVPGATVVIVNPEHYAVALKWSRDSKRAPVCVAKGVDELAKKIRELAAKNGVPIRRDPVTARAIYASVKVGREIDRAHYAAVAAAIHFAEAIARRRKES